MNTETKTKHLKYILAAIGAIGVTTFALGATASADTYTVKNGDTLSTIAETHGTIIEDIIDANHIIDKSFILSGEKLNLNKSQGESEQAMYVVKAGDTISKIANDNNTTIAEIVQLNNLQNDNLIFVGQVLKLHEKVTPVVVDSASQNSSVTDVASVSNQDATPVTRTANTHAVVATGSTYDQFIAAGGTQAMWSTIVVPESGGNPNAVSPNGYRGLGQTKQAWGSGDVATQTQGMINYATSRYGSIENATAFRAANGW